MATLGFEVHTDKENVLSASVSRKGIKGLSAQPLGSRQKNQLLGPTPVIRKALQNVNHQIPMSSSQKHDFAKNISKDTVCSQSKAKSTLAIRSNDRENMPAEGIFKKMDGKKTPSLLKQNTFASAQRKKRSKTKSSKTKVKVEVEPIPPHIVVPNEDEYDSDTIFPRSERLSSYVDKLLMWRPPCLFGIMPDSESDNEEKLELPEEILEIPPVPLIEIPDDLDLPDNIDDLVPLDVSNINPQEETSRGSSPQLTDQSFNASLPLGTLEMNPWDINFFGVSNENDLRSIIPKQPEQQ